MKRCLRSILLILCLSFSSAQADSSVFAYSSDKPITEVYDKVYRSLEAARFYVVFEPNIGKNLSKFAERWGDQYNRSKLSARQINFINLCRRVLYLSGRRRREWSDPTHSSASTA